MAPSSFHGLRPIAVLGGVAAVALLPVSASAFQTVVVGGQTWKVDTFTGPYSTNAAKFAQPSAGGAMPWFSSESLANQFAAALGAGLGLKPPISIPGLPNATGIGPFFAYSRASAPVVGSLINSSVYAELGTQPPTTTTFSSVPLPENVAFVCPAAGCSYRFATATLAEPVPGPLPLLGAGAAFGYSRRLRSRIRRSTTV